MLASLLVLPTAAYTATPVESNYFYGQLNDRAKKIYDLLYQKFKDGQSYAGTESIDLVSANIATETDVQDYIKGNKNVFNDFCAAKDALDLDHSELWWIDSGYLSFRVEKEENGSYQMLIGPGRGENYLLAGEEIPDAASADAEVKARIADIVSKAKASMKAEYSEEDNIASMVRTVHDEITQSISYRYEIDCSKPENAKYIRTLRALLTHEGVCESYARAMQVCLTQLGIKCVLVHGLQTKGTPEDHMWCEVQIGGKWYAVDPTWDDPVSANYDGTMNKDGKDGKDGKENTTYLLVGQCVVGEYWHPSGYVSQGNFEFTYPAIETASYNGSVAFQGENGLTVNYSAGSGSMEDGTPRRSVYRFFPGNERR